MMDKRKNGKGTIVNISSVLKLLVAVFFLVTLPAQVHAFTPDQIFDEVKDSIVVVKTLRARGRSGKFALYIFGGVLIDENHASPGQVRRSWNPAPRDDPRDRREIDLSR